MTLLRHPVVITSLEEDFRKIGLITEAHDEDANLQGTDDDTDDTDEVDEACASKKGKKGKKMPMSMESDEDDEDDEVSEDDEDDEDTEAMAEAIAFHESAKQMWEEMGAAGVETITLDDEDMAEMESMAGSITELPLEVIGEDAFGEEDGEEFDENSDEDSDESASSAFESVAQAMSAIEAILDEETSQPSSLEEATPAFANIALIAEKLYGFFSETAEVQEDAEYTEIAEAYKNIAQYAAAIVDTLQTEDPDTINFDALTETFQEYLGTVLRGLETYAILREADEGDEDEDEGEEQDEGNE